MDRSGCRTAADDRHAGDTVARRPRHELVLEKASAKTREAPSEDQHAAALLGSSSQRELAADPHVRGITDEILKALQADLLAAQSQH